MTSFTQIAESTNTLTDNLIIEERPQGILDYFPIIPTNIIRTRQLFRVTNFSATVKIAYQLVFGGDNRIRIDQDGDDTILDLNERLDINNIFSLMSEVGGSANYLNAYQIELVFPAVTCDFVQSPLFRAYGLTKLSDGLNRLYQANERVTLNISNYPLLRPNLSLRFALRGINLVNKLSDNAYLELTTVNIENGSSFVYLNQAGSDYIFCEETGLKKPIVYDMLQNLEIPARAMIGSHFFIRLQYRPSIDPLIESVRASQYPTFAPLQYQNLNQL